MFKWHAIQCSGHNIEGQRTIFFIEAFIDIQNCIHTAILHILFLFTCNGILEINIILYCKVLSGEPFLKWWSRDSK